jgi:Zn2+/Cd2+-exporting ATPase
MLQHVDLTISGMDCADCARTLEKGVGALAGVSACRVNFATARMKVTGHIDEAVVIERIRSLGYDLASGNKRAIGPAGRNLWLDLLQRPRNLLTLGGAVLIGLAFGLEWSLGSQPIVVGLLVLGGLAGLYFPARSGWFAIRTGQGLDINVLMTIAAVGAFAIGEYAEAATVIVLFSLGEALEGFTLERTRDSIRNLTSLAPAEATVVRPCLDCQNHQGQVLPDGAGTYSHGPCPWCDPHEQTVPAAGLAVGDRVRVKPGDAIPVDAIISRGRSAINEAPITGESVPVEKAAGAQVYAGTINGNGALEIEVTHLAEDSTLARLIHLVEEAQSQQTPTQRFVDRFSRIYTPVVVASAILLAVLPSLLFGQPFFDTPTARGWLYRALAMLVVACPCALVIATPVTVISAISSAARRGVLIKGGAFLEALGKVKVVALDKTGTLTHGRPELTRTACIDNCCYPARLTDPLAACNCCDENLALAAALERFSNHPLAQAVTRAADGRGLPAVSASAVEALPGRGITGIVDGMKIVVGNHDLIHDLNLKLDSFCEQVASTEAAGQTVMLVGEGDSLRGLIAISDPPRRTSQQALIALKDVGVLRTIMLTGDNSSVAKVVGQAVGVDEVQARLLPQEKVAVVHDLAARYGPVAMVGDGLNDAPALAAAAVGIAMGGAGTAQALETADVVLMANDLTQLPAVIRLGRRAVNIIRFNIWFSLTIKAIFLVAALLGLATLWMAVFADMGASLLVTLNGMRLLRLRRQARI